MIPLRDTNPTRSTPVVIYALVAMNAAVFLYEISLGTQGMNSFTLHYGLVPYLVTEGGHPEAWLRVLTSMFMHGGWLHIIGNMWFLWIFGDNLEDALGKLRFMIFYLLCGIAAAATQIAVNPDSFIPMIGASGAISGVLAGYVMLFPHSRILTLVPIFIFIQLVELPAFLFIFIWFGYQLLAGTVQLGQVEAGGGVAFWAHVGGFVAGLILVRFFRKRYDPARAYARPRFNRW